MSPFSADKPDIEMVGKEFVKGMLSTLLSTPPRVLMRRVGTVMLHRAQFHNVLFKHIPNHVGMYTSKRLVSYSDSEDANEPITLVFVDGTEAICDLLIGADGVKSAVRATMYEKLASCADAPAKAEELRGRIPPRFSGAVAYRGVIPREKLIQAVPPERSLWYTGKIVRISTLICTCLG